VSLNIANYNDDSQLSKSGESVETANKSSAIPVSVFGHAAERGRGLLAMDGESISHTPSLLLSLHRD